MVKEIELTRGYVALVDDEDYEELSKYKWCVSSRRNNRRYARRRGRKEEGNRWRKEILMHREIIKTPLGMQTDHIDGDGLNNCRNNLRSCTNGQNGQNKGLIKTNTSGFMGVRYILRQLKGGQVKMVWEVRMRIKGKDKYFGSYKTAIEAAHAYDKAIDKHRPKFGRKNFPSI